MSSFYIELAPAVTPAERARVGTAQATRMAGRRLQSTHRRMVWWLHRALTPGTVVSTHGSEYKLTAVACLQAALEAHAPASVTGNPLAPTREEDDALWDLPLNVPPMLFCMFAPAVTRRRTVTINVRLVADHGLRGWAHADRAWGLPVTMRPVASLRLPATATVKDLRTAVTEYDGGLVQRVVGCKICREDDGRPLIASTAPAEVAKAEAKPLGKAGVFDGTFLCCAMGDRPASWAAADAEPVSASV